MMSSPDHEIVDNHGIGALYATFTIMQRQGKSPGEMIPSLTEENLGCAVSLSGNNEVSNGSYGSRLLGRLEYVSVGVATVKIAGIIRLPMCNFSTIPGCLSPEQRFAILGPRIDEPVCLTGDGKVQRSLDGHNRVLAINDDGTCDVLL